MAENSENEREDWLVDEHKEEDGGSSYENKDGLLQQDLQHLWWWFSLLSCVVLNITQCRHQRKWLWFFLPFHDDTSSMYL